MYESHETGILGENIAEKFLLKNGCEIIEKNFKVKQGEIDIIAKDKDYLVFIEVKTRKQGMYGIPADAVDNLKKKHILKVAQIYINKYKLHNSFIRIDVISIYIKKHNSYNLTHIKQAF